MLKGQGVREELLLNRQGLQDLIIFSCAYFFFSLSLSFLSLIDANNGAVADGSYCSLTIVAESRRKLLLLLKGQRLRGDILLK